MPVHARKIGVARDSMDDEEAPAVRSQKLLHLTRGDLAQIPEARCKEILTQYDPLVRGFVRRFPRALFGPRFDAEDLYSLSRVLLLQFWLLYDPARDEGRGSFQGWASFLFRQVLAKISRDLQNNPELPILTEVSEERREPRGLVVGSLRGWMETHLTVDFDPEAAMDEQLELALLERAMDELPGRQRFILQGVREGRTTAQIAEDLAITRQRVDQIRVDAMANLRRIIGELRGSDEESTEPDEEPDRSQIRRVSTTLVA